MLGHNGLPGLVRFGSVQSLRGHNKAVKSPPGICRMLLHSEGFKEGTKCREEVSGAGWQTGTRTTTTTTTTRNSGSCLCCVISRKMHRGILTWGYSFFIFILIYCATPSIVQKNTIDNHSIKQNGTVRERVR